MDNLSHSSKLSNGNTKNVYSDVFGGGPKFKIPTFSSKVEDYTDIFSSYHSGASSIPVLDLPVVGDDEIVDAQSLKFDYKEIFGGFDDDDYAVPYQELFFETKAEEESDSDEDVWTPAETGSPSGESSEDPVCSKSNQALASVETPYDFDGVKQFNVSYHKTNQRSNDDGIGGFTRIAQLNAVPAYTFLVDGDRTLQMDDCNNQLPDTANSHGLNVATDGAKDGERLWEAIPPQPACADVSRTSESDQKLQKSPDGNGTDHEKAFVTVTDVSLRTQPSEVPPPARPPPKFTIKQGCNKSMASNLKPSKSYARHGVAIDRSPPFFDVEVDASLSAAASAAAMKEAMEKAQARLKSAKELMERRKDGPQYRKNLWMNEGSKGKERREGGIAHDAYRVDEENSHEHFGKGMNSNGFDREERHKAVQGAQVESDVDEKERLLSVSTEAIDQSHVKECRLTQGSKKQEEVIGEWKAEEQFYELVKQDTSGKVLVASKQKISERNSMPTRVYDREQSERNAAEVVEFSNREEHEKKLKECIEREENEKKKKESLQREEKERRQRETYEREENEKKQKALEREEKERRLREACEREEKERSLREAREREEIERKEKALEMEANERRRKEAYEREENEKKQKALEMEENERRQREALEWEENEKKQQAFEREENERKQREVLAREACVREQNEKRLNEIKQREENERREKEAHEREENENRVNEKKQKEAYQREETERRQKEAHYIIENEKRLEESREREEKETELKEAAERNEKDAHEQEENANIPNVSHEQDKDEKRLKEPCEQEVTEKVLPNGKCETLGDEKKLRKPQKQKATEMKEVSHQWERNEMKSKKASELEDMGNRHIEACEREEKDNGVSQDFHLCSNEENNLKTETEVNENAEYVTKVKAANNAHMQVEHENSEITCDGSEQEENNTKLEMAQESCTEEEYGTTVNTAQHAFEHGENEKVLKVVELLREQDANEWLRGECLAEDSPEYEECENNKMAVLNPKLDDSEKKTGTLEETVTEVKDKRCTTENSVALDCKERKKSIKEPHGPCVENGMTAKLNQPISEEFKTVKIKIADQDIERKEKKLNGTAVMEEREKEGRLLNEREQEKERLRKLEEDIQREREKDKMAVERATREARERAYIEVRERAERAAVERATAEARQRAMAEARERLEKACAEAREKSLAEKASTESRLRAERAAVERATAEARERAAEKAAMEAKERVERSVSEKFSTTSRDSGLRHSGSFSDLRDAQFQGSSSFTTFQRYSSSTSHGASDIEKSQVTEVESAQRCKARLERHQRTVERAAKALSEKNMRDYLAQREQTERNRLAETLDADVKRWSNGKQGNLRALLSTLQYILGPESGWQPVPLTDVITAVAVKKAYRKATLCVHPDKLQQRGATIQQKYVCEKVFDLLKEAWNKFNSEER